MNTHEFQAKEILKKYGVAVPEYAVVTSVDEARQAVKAMKLNEAVVKVQVHAGGRGKAGGVKLAYSPDEIVKHAEQMLGMKIVNKQTGADGIVCNQVMISELTDIDEEYYVGAIIDRHSAEARLIISPEGGMDIEEVAETKPDRVKTFAIGLNGELRGYQQVQIAKFMGWSGNTAKQGRATVAALAKAFCNTDASLLEINPLVKTRTGDIVAVDAKLSVDDNALYRQQEIAAMYDASQIPIYEARAKHYDLAYVALEGNIGCMVNGAGLAMATMDIIHHFGGAPANFLDVGGSATEEKIAEGFKILLSDHKVKAILVNIFGGIMNCGTLASGIVAAAKTVDLTVPLVVRMEGTNVDQGKQILADSGIEIAIADSMTTAAEKAVAAAKGA
ncbi:MAG: ADP-forming succinate--CoA ligase subunit beta [Chlamydiales bacterium]|nr:ADP-forming succinate--CoA ligase subunit beta [Chlamydiia bacterium]MCP5507060.1 ADP-forming succinate--CoA ligase subunit beta [Chlamydiales bacterium]